MRKPPAEQAKLMPKSWRESWDPTFLTIQHPVLNPNSSIRLTEGRGACRRSENGKERAEGGAGRAATISVVPEGSLACLLEGTHSHAGFQTLLL